MPQFVFALLVVFGGLWFLRKLGRTPQAQQGNFMRKIAGGAICGFAGLLMLRGMSNVAIPLFVFGLGLMGQASLFPGGIRNGFPFGGKRSSGQKSRVETGLLAMELDHDSGQMEGTVKAGPFASRQLGTLSDSELVAFHSQCGRQGDQSQQLYEAWLDRNKQGWRESWGSNERREAPRANNKMSREQALQVLGLKEGASAGDIRTAHRRLMKGYHPDHGGSDYLAAQINEAKAVLLGS